MQFTMKFLALMFGVLMLATAAYAESPREQLQQMVEQLRKSPADNALREKIIRLAQEIKPAPPVPEEAIRYEGRAQYVFSNAKNEQDYIDAAKEYERAVGAAPWVVGYYSDLCTIYEKAGKLAEAKHNCEFFLAGTSDTSLAVDVKRRIAGLEIGIERNRPDSIAARKIEESKKRGVAGFWQLQSWRTVYSNVETVKEFGAWKDPFEERKFRATFEFRKIDESYEINFLTRPDLPYRTIRTGVTNIEFGRSGSTCASEIRNGCEKYRCELAGEGLFCTHELSGRSSLSRYEERYIRLESCVSEPHVVGFDDHISVRCR